MQIFYIWWEGWQQQQHQCKIRNVTSQTISVLAEYSGLYSHIAEACISGHRSMCILRHCTIILLLRAMGDLPEKRKVVITNAHQ